ncbi:hypothetical protein Hanom_Chr13g01212831 [Helianthus anomalus]
MFVCLTYQKKILVRVCSFIKRMNINEPPPPPPAEQLTRCSLSFRLQPTKNIHTRENFIR